MAVVNVTAIKDRQASINSKYEPSYTHTYLVETDDPYTSPAAVRNSVGFGIGDSYTYDANAKCTSVSASCTSEDGLWWTVTVEFGKWEEKPENPLDKPLEIEWSFAQFEKDVDEDVDGKAVVNKAGDPFLETIKKDDSRPILSITRNEASFNYALAYQYRDVVNRSPFYGAPKGTVKVSNISSSRQFDANFGYYWTTKYEFSFALEGWKKKVLNVGMREKDGNKRKNVLVNGVPVNDPVPLDKDGKVMPPGNPPLVLEFKVYPEADFSVFNF